MRLCYHESLTETVAEGGHAPPMISAPQRVLRIITRLNIGGPAIHVGLLSTRLDPRQFMTHLVIGQPDSTEGDLRHLVDSPHATSSHLPTVTALPTLVRSIRPWADLRTLIRVLRIIWREQPRIIHT